MGHPLRLSLWYLRGSSSPLPIIKTIVRWMLPNEIRKKNTADSLVLTKALRSQIQPLGLPTIPFRLVQDF